MKLDFLIIGAPKSGTSWLANNLRANPGIYMPRQEIHYFSRYFESEPSHWYASFFLAHAPGQLIGERSNSYMTDPEAAARIRDAFPEVKLLAILRNPVERAYSGYCMRLDRAFVNRDICLHLDPANPLSRDILRNGFYREQLSRFTDLFPRERLYVAIFDDIASRPRELLADISEFLGAPYQFEGAAVKERLNARKNNGVRPGLKRLLRPIMRSERTRAAVLRALNASAIGRALLRASSGKLQYPPLTDAIRSKLVAFYRDEVKGLEDFTGRDLCGWRR